MSDNHRISEFIDGISFRKTLGGGFRPDDVYDSICQLTSLYNEVLADSYREIDELKKRLEEREYIPPAPASTVSSAVAEIEECPAEEDFSEHRPEIDFRSIFGEELEDYRAIKARFYYDAPSEKTGAEKTVLQDDRAERSADKKAKRARAADIEPNDGDGTASDGDLRRMKRSELLELLLEQSRENERLRSCIDEKERALDALNEKLCDRTIKMEKAGTMAEASLLVNGVLEAAQAAADQYLENLKSYSKREELNCRKKEEESAALADRLIADAKKQCDSMLKSAEDRCSALSYITAQQCEAMKAEAVSFCTTLEEDTRQKCDELEAFTKKKCDERERQTEDRCRSLDKKAQEESAKCWDDVSRRMDDFYKMQDYLKELLDKKSSHS